MLYIQQKQIQYLLGISTALFLLFPFQGVFASEITSDTVIKLVNEARLANKAGVLVKDEVLTHVAQMKVEDMVEKKYFAHTSPEGKTPWMWFEKAGYSYRYAGENLAIHFTQAEEQQQAWMESPTHRKNILNPNYTEIGVAIWKGDFEGHETIITVQEFGKRANETTVSGGVSSVSIGEDSLEQETKLNVSKGTVLFSKATDDGGSSGAAQAYEKVLLLLWVMMIAQAGILGVIVFRVPRKKVRVAPVYAQEGNREYVIPVRILSKKTVRVR